MKCFILSIIVSTNLFVFGVGYEKVPEDAPRVDQSKVEVAIGRHKNGMEGQAALRWLNKDTMYACLVADRQLKDHFPDMHIAQKVVNALPDDVTGFLASDATRMQHVADELYVHTISKEALLAGKGKAALTAIVIAGKSDPEKKLPYIKVFFNGSEAPLWWTFDGVTRFSLPHDQL